MVRLPLLALLLIAAPLSARDDAFVPDPAPPVPASVREAPDWSESAVELPPWPKPGDLVEFSVDGPDQGFRYAIDGRHLAVGDDDVVRYTIVAESASGARNVSFEGIRCTPNGQYRVYAYGNAGRFIPIADTRWHRIEQAGGAGYRQDLWRSYLCVQLKFAPRPRSDMLRALRHGRVSRLENTGFLPD